MSKPINLFVLIPLLCALAVMVCSLRAATFSTTDMSHRSAAEKATAKPKALEEGKCGVVLNTPDSCDGFTKEITHEMEQYIGIAQSVECDDMNHERKKRELRGKCYARTCAVICQYNHGLCMIMCNGCSFHGRELAEVAATRDASESGAHKTAEVAHTKIGNLKEDPLMTDFKTNPACKKCDIFLDPFIVGMQMGENAGVQKCIAEIECYACRT